MIHVIPINDLSQHRDASTCWCSPQAVTLDNGDTVIVHQARDGREHLERALDCDDLTERAGHFAEYAAKLGQAVEAGHMDGDEFRARISEGVEMLIRRYAFVKNPITR